MSITNYVKENHKGYIFDSSLVQCWQNKFIANATMEREIVRKKMNGDVGQAEIDAAAFCYEHVVATEDMLRIVCNAADDKDFRDKLDKLVLYRVLNRFILCNDDRSRDFPKDAMWFYTLDLAGKYLLEHYWKNYADRWSTGTPGLCVEKISRALVAGEFHVKLLDSCPNKLKEFKCRTYRQGRESATLSFEFRLEVTRDDEIVKRYFIGDVIRSFEDEADMRERINFISSICSTKAWQRLWPYSGDVPVVLFVVEDETKIEELINYLRMYKIPKFFITTDVEIANGLDRPVGVWKRFNEELLTIEDAKTKMFID